MRAPFRVPMGRTLAGSALRRGRFTRLPETSRWRRRDERRANKGVPDTWAAPQRSARRPGRQIVSAGPAARWTAEPWQTSFVRCWQAAHRTGADNGLSFLAPLQHQQVYDPCFPQRWRTYVLSRSPTASGSATVAPGIAWYIPAAGVVLPPP
ncbi:hypothetical protein SHO565_53680 [Streptomyces sp. HO565]